MKLGARCKAKQKCEDCKAFVGCGYWKDTPNGGWSEEWEECAFGHIKLSKEEYNKIKEIFKEEGINNEKF